MKKVTILLALTALLLGATSVYAGSQGSAAIPHMQLQAASSSTPQYVNYFFSNITDHEVECSLKLYDHSGNILGPNYFNVYTGAYGSAAFSKVASGNTFTLAAHESRAVQFWTSSVCQVFGYGVIEWTSTTDNISKALFGSATKVYYSAGSGLSMSLQEINDGQPF